MNRIFIRALWGIYDKSDRILIRRYRMDENIKILLKNKFNTPFKTYVWGKDNSEYLQKNGITDTILVKEEPYQFDLIKEQYRHKLEAIKLAHTEYDEVLQLDWDCYLSRELPADFWEVLGKKSSFQANLQQYHNIKCKWRRDHKRKVPNGGFTYTRGPEPIERIIKLWERLDNDNKKSCEPTMGMYVDELQGGLERGEFDLERYWDENEPEWCHLHRDSVYPDRVKNYCFKHYQGSWLAQEFRKGIWEGIA